MGRAKEGMLERGENEIRIRKWMRDEAIRKVQETW
jgi:hypothetical protein